MGVNGTGLLSGHSHYYPIYEAAAELGLPIVIEAGNESNIYTLTHHSAGGPPLNYSEYRILSNQAMTSHLGSLIAQGVFERFPELRVLALGAGADWVSGDRPLRLQVRQPWPRDPVDPPTPERVFPSSRFASPRTP